MREFEITKGNIGEIKEKLKLKLDHYSTLNLEHYHTFCITAGVDKDENYMLYFTTFNMEDKDYTDGYIIEGKDIGEMLEEMFETIDYIRPHRNETKTHYLSLIQGLKDKVSTQEKTEEEKSEKYYIIVPMTLSKEKRLVVYGTCESEEEALKKIDSLKSEKMKYYDDYKVLTKKDIKNFGEIDWRNNVKL